MSVLDSPLKHNPLEVLGKLLKIKGVPCLPPPARPMDSDPQQGSAPTSAVPDTVHEAGAFREAMEGVKPLARENCHERKPPPARASKQLVEKPEDEVRQRLENLVKTGEGFIISQTPEYQEGTGRGIPPAWAERLHRGDFSIQAHLDLHGLRADQAREAFDHFLRRAIRSGQRCVLVIHGRGISSPGAPVLKAKVAEWLTRSHWRKWVIAFASAQSYDGGAGATYILLRHRRQDKGPGKK